MRKAIDYGPQVARGLAAAHEKGVVHRDLKPDNLVVTKDGRVKSLDFGLGKLVGGDMLTEGETHTAGMVPATDVGKVLGTVGHMSPEQVRAQTVDHHSDIFSFGAVLYEMLSGRRAFRGTSAVETMNNEAGRDARLWQQAVEGGDPRPLTDEGVIGTPSLDGKWAVVASPDGYHLVDIEGRPPPATLRGVLPDDGTLRFSRDGRHLIVRARGSHPARLFRVEFSTGRREAFAEVGPREKVSGGASPPGTLF
jgi:serine/threonine protein kinase